MADKVTLGFRFLDGSFFNAAISRRYWKDTVEGIHGNFNMQGFVGEIASRAGLHITNGHVHQIIEGGVGGYPLNVLFGAAQQDTMEQGPSNSQDHDSQELADDTQNIQDDQDQDDDSFNDGASTSAVSSGSSNLSKTVWSHNGILLLIEAYRQKRHYLDDPTKRRSEMWTAISAIMRSKGHVITPEACNKKMDNLRQRYKMIKDRNGRTGAGRSSWPYFEKMDQVLGKDPDVTPPVVVSSLNGRKEADAEPSEGEFSSTRTGSPTTPLCGLLQKKRQEKKSGPPQWLKDYEERQDQRLQKLVSVGEKRNSLLEKLIEKLG